MPVPHREFHQDAPMPRVPFKSAEKRTPDKARNVSLPYLESLMAGGTAFVLVGAACIATRKSVNAALWAFTVFGFIMLFIGIIRAYKQQIIYTVEKIKNEDINKDGVIGAPTVKQVTAFELPRGNHSLKLGELEIAPALLIDWCRAAVNQRSLAYGVWEPRFALPDGTKGRERYQAFRDELVAQGFAEEVGGNIGLRIRWQNQDAVNWVSGFAQVTLANGRPLLE